MFVVNSTESRHFVCGNVEILQNILHSVKCLYNICTIDDYRTITTVG